MNWCVVRVVLHIDRCCSYVCTLCVIMCAACAVCVIGMNRVVDLCCSCGGDVGVVGVCNGTDLRGGVGDGYNRIMRFLWYDGTVTTDVLYMTMVVHVRCVHTHQHPDHDSTYGPHDVCPHLQYMHPQLHNGPVCDDTCPQSPAGAEGSRVLRLRYGSVCCTSSGSCSTSTEPCVVFSQCVIARAFPHVDRL